jgi:hypothetical protein
MTKQQVDDLEWVRALVALAALAALVTFVALAYAVPALTCGCTQPPSPTPVA